MSLSLSLILKEMRKKIPLNKQHLDISPEVKRNIKQIQKICNENYSNQSFYGSAALNRKILLDKRIANLLTPETIIAILAIHATTTDPAKSPIGISRNSSGYISLAAVLFYGFSEGLETIRLMPNNEPRYGSAGYQEQKKQFAQNTKKIIENIKQAATKLGIPLEEEQFQLKVEKEQHLTELFQKITSVIATIKNDNQGEKLLSVPTYTPNDIREQSLRGFKQICAILNIKHSISKKGIVIEGSTSLDDFIDKFLSSEEALLDGTVIHLFYDRVHLEACIEQDTKIIFQNKTYYLRDILREIIKKCETSPTVSNTAKEQFSIRLKLCDAHLKGNFPSYYRESTKLDDSMEHFPTGYKEIKRLISNLELEINQALWICCNLEELYVQRDFLVKMLECYDRSNGTLPLKKCLVLAKWHYPQGYEKVINKIGAKFFVDLLDNKVSRETTQGPRLKNNASIALEKLLHLLLIDNVSIVCSYNVLNELEITVGDNYFNITQILQNNPDFEHLSFTDEQLSNYANFVTNKAHNKPKLVRNKERIVPSSTDYDELDKEGVSSHLHYGEKLALTLYSSNFYTTIQSFLRQKGQISLPKAPSTKLNQLIPEILLSTAVAAHGLAKPSLSNKSSDSDTSMSNYRKEFANPDSNFFKSRLESKKREQPLFEKGFLSTSADNSFKNKDANTFTVFHEDSTSNTIGKRIEAISTYKHEKEFLYGPGTQLQYTDYYKQGNYHFFAVRPIRSIDGIGANSYTDFMLAKHELEIINKMFEQHLISQKHSFIRRLFDTVANNKKLDCIKQVKIEIKKILETLQPNENLKSEHLEICKKSLEEAIEMNKQLVMKALLPASLGKTNKILEDALLRINRAIKLVVSEERIEEQKFPNQNPI